MKAKNSTNVAPVGVRLNSAMKFIERIRKRVATKDAEITKKEEVRLLQSQRAEGDSKFGRSRGPIGVSQGRGGADQRSSTTFGERGSRISSHAASDRRIASGTCLFLIQRDQSNGVRRGRQGSVWPPIWRNPRRVGGRVQACSPVFWLLVERQQTHPR